MKTPSTAVYSAAANENLFGISEKAIQAIQEALPTIHSYPNPHAYPLRLAISQQLGLKPEEVVVGSGSAELISLLIRTLCSPFTNSAVLSTEPTYPLYQHEAEALVVAYKTAPLNSSYDFDINALLNKIDASTRILFISNPNNPTGTYLTQPQLEQLVNETPAHVVLVLDEAYIEFTNAPDFGSALPYLQQRENLVILRTFSKAYGLASMRVGYMLAQEAILAKVMQVKQPYNVNNLAQVAALASLCDQEHLAYTVAETAAGKVHLQDILDKLGVQWWPSEGNFLYTDAGMPAHPLVARLQEQGVLVRNSSSKFGIRITIGPKPHQEYLHEQLKSILHPDNIWQDAVLAEILKTGHRVASLQGDDLNNVLAPLSQLVKGTGNAAERIALAYHRAFANKLSVDGHEHAGNLYSSTYGTTDMISAFNVLMKSTPLVTFGHHLANLAIADTVADAPEIHVLDLGIGSGLQWLHLMDMLVNRSGNKVRLRITGVDIPSAGDDDPAIRLRMTGEQLQAHASSIGLDFSYTGIAQKLEDIDLQELDFSPSEVLVVNSAFTLHHLPDQLTTAQDYRDRILQQIKALNPVLLTLTEPDSEHNRLSFLPRLRESLRHYYTVFDVLDTLLPPLLPERQVIEQEFFGREIINVISCEGINRVERHERNEAWQQRMIRNGFTPAAAKVGPESIKKDLTLHENFTLEQNGEGYSLCWKNTPVVAATLWV